LAILGLGLLFVVLPIIAIIGIWYASPWGCEYRWVDQETYWQPIACYVVIDGVRYPEDIIVVIDGVMKTR